MIVATHDGPFHADEAMAIAILRDCLTKDFQLIRTRDHDTLTKADICIDVGHEYDPARGRFDHHQAGFTEVRPDGMQYASAGLVWRHFAPCKYPTEIIKRVDHRLIRCLDGHDSGHPTHTGWAFTLSSLVTALNPTWDETRSHDDAFTEATAICVRALSREIRHAEAFLAAEPLVRAALERRRDPHILQLERVLPVDPKRLQAEGVQFTIAPDGPNWIARTVSTGAPDTPKFPAAWAGLAGSDLVQASGIEGAIFCHAGRFLVVASTREAISEMLGAV